MCTLMLCIFFLERASFMTLPNSHTCFLAHNRLNECLLMARRIFLPLNPPSKIYKPIDDESSFDEDLLIGTGPIAAFAELANSKKILVKSRSALKAG